MSMINSYNTFLRKHYYYNPNEEEEIRSHIYKNKLTNDLSGLITIFKSTPFRVKARLNLLVDNGLIYLVVTPLYFEEVTPDMKQELVENLRKNLSKDRVIINDPEEVTEITFRVIRTVEL